MFSLALLTAFALAADSKDDRGLVAVIKLDRATDVSYEKEILPLLSDKCIHCHSDTIVRGKYDMGTYESVLKGGKSGAAIVPGKSADSLLVQMAGHVKKPFMPPKGEEDLTPQELALVKLWIDQGAKGTNVARPKAAVNVSSTSI